MTTWFKWIDSHKNILNCTCEFKRQVKVDRECFWPEIIFLWWRWLCACKHIRWDGKVRSWCVWSFKIKGKVCRKCSSSCFFTYVFLGSQWKCNNTWGMHMLGNSKRKRDKWKEKQTTNWELMNSRDRFSEAMNQWEALGIQNIYLHLHLPLVSLVSYGMYGTIVHLEDVVAGFNLRRWWCEI